MKNRRMLVYVATLISLILSGVVFLPTVSADAPPHTAVIAIPAIDVDAPIVPVFVRRFPDGNITWDVSGLSMTVGFFEGLPWFGWGSNVVLGGHSQLAPGQPDVFYNLDQVSIGDEIIITETGSVRRYSVTNVYRANQYDIAPLRPTSHEQLTLITCDSASYDANSGGYNNRVVVVALPTQ